MSVLDVVGSLRWRVGAPLDRGVYAVSAKEGGDIFVCICKETSVAAYVVQLQNDELESQQSRSIG